VKTIGHEVLKQMLDRHEPIRLVMALSEWARPAQAYSWLHPLRHLPRGAAVTQQGGRDCRVLFR
jgi:hypothetical protein